MPVRGWRLVLALVMMASLAFALRPLRLLEGPENWFWHADKVHHLWFFALLWLLAVRARLATPAWRLGLGLLAFGLAIELAQALAPTGRSASLMDLLSDAAGIACGCAIAAFRSARAPAEHRG
jgi:VanZ family protein